MEKEGVFQGQRLLNPLITRCQHETALEGSLGQGRAELETMKRTRHLRRAGCSMENERLNSLARRFPRKARRRLLFSCLTRIRLAIIDTGMIKHPKLSWMIFHLEIR